MLGSLLGDYEQARQQQRFATLTAEQARLYAGLQAFGAQPPRRPMLPPVPRLQAHQCDGCGAWGATHVCAYCGRPT